VIVGFVGVIAAGSADVAGAKNQAVRPQQTTRTPTATASGSAGLLLVGLGDSVPAAADCSGCTSYVDLFGDNVSASTHSAVAVDNDGVDGQSSAGLLNALAVGSTEATRVADADVLTVTIGANDFNSGRAALQDGTCGGSNDLSCFGTTVTTMQTNVTAIIEQIQQLRGDQPVAINVTGYWNVFQDGAVAADRYGAKFQVDSDRLTREANGAIQQAAQRTGATYVDIYTPIKAHDPDTALLSPDGDHLSQSGHDLVAATLASAGTMPS